MLKRLRIKFVCINMLIVLIMLGIIFGFVLHFTRHNLETAGFQMLQSAVGADSIPDFRMSQRPLGDTPMLPEPYFILDIDAAGNIASVWGNYYSTTDSGAELVGLAQVSLAQGADRGTLDDFGLRYVRHTTATGVRVAFADVTTDQTMLRSLIRTCLLIGLGALVAFFFLSLLLARWAVKPVDVAWRQQKQFVADASHELKTPLTVIMTNAELLGTPQCSEVDRAQFSDSILVMSRQMRGLVESLLELARIDGGSVKTEFARLNFSELTADALLPFEPVFFERGLSLTADIAPDITVRGSAGHLKQLVDILLDNAQKYSAPGGETVVRLQRSGRSRCLLSVSDPGEALSPEELKAIFKRFYRADKARTMNHSYGLGLAIAQSVAEEHRGKIRAESRDGRNTFFVELPLAN